MKLSINILFPINKIHQMILSQKLYKNSKIKSPPTTTAIKKIYFSSSKRISISQIKNANRYLNVFQELIDPLLIQKYHALLKKTFQYEFSVARNNKNKVTLKIIEKLFIVINQKVTKKKKIFKCVEIC